jgi:prophage regulatory protein
MPVLRKIPRPDPDARFWRLAAVCAYTQRSRSTIYRDQSFPRPVRLGPNSIAWRVDEVRRWCELREQAARAAA